MVAVSVLPALAQYQIVVAECPLKYFQKTYQQELGNDLL
jgi:hypothetical protein